MANLTQAALWAGIPFGDIGGLTPADVSAAVQIESEKQKDLIRIMAWLIYTGASLTAIGFNDPKKFPSLEDAFPSLFEKKEQQNWIAMKERVEAFRKEQNHAGGAPFGQAGTGDSHRTLQ